MSDKRYTLDVLTGILGEMGNAPDGQLDRSYAKECRVFVAEKHDLPETLRFIRDLRDKCVFTAGGSDFVMQIWSMMLSEYPEPEEEKAERRKELEKWAGM